jgi:hypothetical protein
MAKVVKERRSKSIISPVIAPTVPTNKKPAIANMRRKIKIDLNTLKKTSRKHY